MTVLHVPVSPAPSPRFARRRRAAKPSRIAFLHNGQTAYDAIAPLLTESLQAIAGLSVRVYRKPRYSSPATDAMLDEIAAESDAAIVGLAYRWPRSSS